MDGSDGGMFLLLHLGSLRTKVLAWEEFHEVIYNQFFFTTMIEEKKREFMALE